MRLETLQGFSRFNPQDTQNPPFILEGYELNGPNKRKKRRSARQDRKAIRKQTRRLNKSQAKEDRVIRRGNRQTDREIGRADKRQAKFDRGRGGRRQARIDRQSQRQQNREDRIALRQDRKAQRDIRRGQIGEKITDVVSNIAPNFLEDTRVGDFLEDRGVTFDDQMIDTRQGPEGMFIESDEVEGRGFLDDRAIEKAKSETFWGKYKWYIIGGGAVVGALLLSKNKKKKRK